MFLLTTSKIDLDSIFNSDQKITIKLRKKSKGKQRIVVETLEINSLTTYLSACKIIITEILDIQRRLHDFTRLVNISKERFIQLIGNGNTYATALSILSDGLGIVEINHRYRYNEGGGITSYPKSYIIAQQYIGEIITTAGYPHIHSKENNQITGVSVQRKGNNKETPIVDTPTTTCSTTGRVYSDVTRMSKIDRKKLVDGNGENLIEIDFSSSHLQHLTKCISEDLANNDYVPLFGENGKDYCYDEIERFKKDVLQGDFYATLAEKWSIVIGTVYSRDQMKNNVMHFITGAYQNRKVSKWLREKYPQITHYIDYVNEKESSGTKTYPLGKAL